MAGLPAGRGALGGVQPGLRAGRALPVRLLRTDPGGGCLRGTSVAASCYADGAYDVLTSGTNGRIADPENPEAFAACLDGMLSKPLPADKLRRAVAEKFSFDAGAEGYARAVEIAEGAVKHG